MLRKTIKLKTYYPVMAIFLAILFVNMIRMKEFLTINVKSTSKSIQKAHLTDNTVVDPSGIWIHVTSYGDGFTCYTKAISQILVLAKQIDATFVEPCILNGAFYPCDHVRILKEMEKTSDPPLQLSDIYDLDLLKEYHPKIVRFETFQNARLSALGILPHFTSSGHKWEMSVAKSNITTYQICMAPIRHDCKDFPSYFNHDHMPIFDNVVQETATRNVMSIIEIYNLRYQGFNRFGDITNLASKMRLKYIRFKHELYDMADSYLEKLGVDIQNDEPFQVIQWRGELSDMDYMECAKKIIHAKDIMISDGDLYANHNYKDNKHPVTILVSSINENTSTMWWGAQQMALSSEWKRYKWFQRKAPIPVVAVKTLLDSGLHKLDQVVNPSKVRDKLFLFVWDLIIIEKATKFATCSDCGEDNYCSKCNYNGHTVKYSMEIREQINKDSQQCWPKEYTKDNK